MDAFLELGPMVMEGEEAEEVVGGEEVGEVGRCLRMIVLRWRVGGI